MGSYVLLRWTIGDDSMLARGVLLLTLWISLWAAAAGAADWPFCLGAKRDNTSADKNLKLWSGDTPKVLWKKNVKAGHSCMTVAGKQLYTQGEGVVWCLDTETGAVVWRYPPTGRSGESTATPAVVGGLVFALGNDHKIVCLDAAKGELQWFQKVADFGVKDGRWAISCSPLVLGNQVIMDLGVVFVLDAKTGKLVWKAGSDTAGFASAVVFGQTGQKRVTSFNGGGLAIYTLAKGEPVAKYKWATDYNIATPIVSEEQDLHLRRRTRLLAAEARRERSPDGLGEQGGEHRLPDLRALRRLRLRRTR